jgi:4-amino-4-deoxy-L-arabinose transferase-like glycosyltransferase
MQSSVQSSIAPYLRHTTVKVGTVLLIVTGLEALIVLQVLGLGYAKLELYDYQVFEQLGVNLMNQAVFSMDDSQPFSPTLFRSPAYPVYIGLIYSLFGKSLMALRLSQFLLLWLTAWLVYRTAARYTDLRCAVVAALLCATYPPFVFVTTQYVAHSLTLFLAAVIVLCLVTLCAQPKPKLPYFFFVGILIAIMTLARPAFQLVLLPAMMAVVMWRPQQPMKRRRLEAAALGIGFALLIAPWVVRNNLVTGNASGLRIVSAGGWSLYTSATQYQGEISYRLLKPEWDVVVADFNWRNLEAAQDIPNVNNPLATAQREILVDQGFSRDAGQKFRELTLRQFMVSYVSRFYWLWSTCDLSPWQTGIFHRFLQIYHVLLTGLVLVGCFLNRSRLMKHGLLWMFVVYQMLLHSIYHVEARYTFEARLFLLIYAGMAMTAIVAFISKNIFSLNTGLAFSRVNPAADSFAKSDQ